MELCENCGGNDFSECVERGDYICNECGGCSPDRYIDQTLEKRNFTGGKDFNRCSEVDYYIEFVGQSTIIGNGRSKLQRIQNQTAPSSQLTSQTKMSKGFSRIRKFKMIFDLNGLIVETAKNLIAEFQKNN